MAWVWSLVVCVYVISRGAEGCGLYLICIINHESQDYTILPPGKQKKNKNSKKSKTEIEIGNFVIFVELAIGTVVHRPIMCGGDYASPQPPKRQGLSIPVHTRHWLRRRDFQTRDRSCRRYCEGHLHCPSEQTARIAEIKATRASGAVIVQHSTLAPRHRAESK